MLIRIATLTPWRGERTADGVALPPNIEKLWTDAELAAVGLVKAKPFVAPEGMRRVPGSEPTYAADGATTWPTEPEPAPPPRQLAKWVVEQRLTDAQLLVMERYFTRADDADAIRNRKKWEATAFPFVNVDDPTMHALLDDMLGMDEAAIARLLRDYDPADPEALAP